MSDLQCVKTSIRGCIKINNGLNFYSDINVVVRSDNDPNNKHVKLISGGGSGHEPAHIGYVGKGMLTAAVCGDIYTSPPMNCILKSILLIGTPTSSIILIVKNYTGDRLNFGLAAEIAKSKYGYQNIQTILVDDDISIADLNSVGKRGLAGTVIIHKIAGAMAEEGLPIQHIVDFCNTILQNKKLCTFGFTFQSNSNELQNIEMGKGIHGEPGVTLIPKASNFNEIIGLLKFKYLSIIPKKSSAVVMLNNLGATSLHHFHIFTSGLMGEFEKCYTVKLRLHGSFLTSMNKEGISVTLLVLDPIYCDDILKYMKAPTGVNTNGLSSNMRPTIKSTEIINLPNVLTPEIAPPSSTSQFTDVEKQMMRKCVEHACEALICSEKMLNSIDAELGDGDTGVTFKTGAMALQLGLRSQAIRFVHPSVFLLDISEVIHQNMGGTSGALLGIFFNSMSSSFQQPNQKPQHRLQWLDALQSGCKSIEQYGRCIPGNRTMLDPLNKAQLELGQMQQDSTVRQWFESMAVACEKEAAATQYMTPKSGRASYSFNADAAIAVYQHPDPGALAIAIICRAIAEGLKF